MDIRKLQHILKGMPFWDKEASGRLCSTSEASAHEGQNSQRCRNTINWDSTYSEVSDISGEVMEDNFSAKGNKKSCSKEVTIAVLTEDKKNVTKN